MVKRLEGSSESSPPPKRKKVERNPENEVVRVVLATGQRQAISPADFGASLRQLVHQSPEESLLPLLNLVHSESIPCNVLGSALEEAEPVWDRYLPMILDQVGEGGAALLQEIPDSFYQRICDQIQDFGAHSAWLPALLQRASWENFSLIQLIAIRKAGLKQNIVEEWIEVALEQAARSCSPKHLVDLFSAAPHFIGDDLSSVLNTAPAEKLQPLSALLSLVSDEVLLDSLVDWHTQRLVELCAVCDRGGSLPRLASMITPEFSYDLVHGLDFSALCRLCEVISPEMVGFFLAESGSKELARNLIERADCENMAWSQLVEIPYQLLQTGLTSYYEALPLEDRTQLLQTLLGLEHSVRNELVPPLLAGLQPSDPQVLNVVSQKVIDSCGEDQRSTLYLFPLGLLVELTSHRFVSVFARRTLFQRFDADGQTFMDFFSRLDRDRQERLLNLFAGERQGKLLELSSLDLLIDLTPLLSVSASVREIILQRFQEDIGAYIFLSPNRQDLLLEACSLEDLYRLGSLLVRRHRMSDQQEGFSLAKIIPNLGLRENASLLLMTKQTGFCHQAILSAIRIQISEPKVDLSCLNKAQFSALVEGGLAPVMAKAMIRQKVPDLGRLASTLPRLPFRHFAELLQLPAVAVRAQQVLVDGLEMRFNNALSGSAEQLQGFTSLSDGEYGDLKRVVLQCSQSKPRLALKLLQVEVALCMGSIQDRSWRIRESHRGTPIDLREATLVLAQELVGQYGLQAIEEVTQPLERHLGELIRTQKGSRQAKAVLDGVRLAPAKNLDSVLAKLVQQAHMGNPVVFHGLFRWLSEGRNIQYLEHCPKTRKLITAQAISSMHEVRWSTFCNLFAHAIRGGLVMGEGDIATTVRALVGQQSAHSG